MIRVLYTIAGKQLAKMSFDRRVKVWEIDLITSSIIVWKKLFCKMGPYQLKMEIAPKSRGYNPSYPFIFGQLYVFFDPIKFIAGFRES